MADPSDDVWKQSPRKKLKIDNEQCMMHCNLDRRNLIKVTSVNQ